MTGLRVTAASHPGRVRSSNQDQLVVSTMMSNGNFVKLSQFDLPSPEIVAVVDGMGGHAGGDVAARIAAATLSSCWDPPTDEETLTRLVHAANHAIYDEVDRCPALTAMGATVVAAVPVSEGWIIGHVGDARAYAVTDGFAVCLTEDDRRPNGRLTQSLGGLPQRAEVVVHTDKHGYDTHDRILLCTDGLFDAIPFTELQEALVERDDRRAVGRLLDACFDAGAPDNATLALLARTGEDGP